ncbi:MAG: DR2241 family protein [Terrimicrobiaceae bacterium]
MGQIVCTGNFVITHSDDVGRSDLVSYHDPEEAALIARFDANHAFRPLKTAPNLKTGWQLVLNSLSSTRLAIDHFYPAALGNALALEEGIPISHDLRDVLQRQTGLYAITKQITDPEASALIADICPPTKCLNHLLWNIGPGHPTPLTIPREHAPQSPLPLLCTEACPLLIGAARSIVRHRQTA